MSETERIEAYRRARRTAAVAYHAAATDLLTHIDAEVPLPIGPLVATCDTAREALLDADLAVNAEQFQLDMVKLIGRRGDQPPTETEEPTR